MARIKTDQPSSGKPLLLYISSDVSGGFVGTGWTEITNAEAPDFSIPASGDDGAVEDPLDPERELRPGEIFIESPLAVINNTSTTSWVELRMLLQGNSGQQIPITPQVPVPAKEAVYLPIQGLRLLKTNLSNTEPGGRLEIRGGNLNSLTIIGTAVELEASDHAPDTED